MLCRGKISSRENIQKELKCRYTNHGNAFLTLAPFREEEEAYVEPRIAIFHDVISNDEIEILKKLTQLEVRLLASSGLCRGEISLPANIQEQLKCRYTDNGNPLLKIGRFKEEEAYLEPRIVIFYDVIYDDEIEILKKLAQPPENIEVGKFGLMSWLKEDEHETIKVLKRRVEHMTTLSVTNAESLQVLCYKIAGFSFPHLDSYSPDKANKLKYGNRFASLLYYLNDVEEGGRTVFEKLNVSLTPKKGSAVFWYNLSPNGMRDPLTLHLGCPVLAGTKWVANLWPNEKDQDILRPCTLDNQPAVDNEDLD